MPSVRAFAAAAHVHRNTAAAVYRDLERFGLVRCVPGSGTFAADRRWSFRPEARLVCADAGLRVLLSAELAGAAVRGGPGDDGRSAWSDTVTLVPLDERPPKGRGVVVPLAPDARTVQALRTLPPAAVVRLVSGSRRLGRLVRVILHALRRADIGLERLDGPAAWAPAAAPAADLLLVDALELRRHGTSRPGEVFLPLRLASHVRLESLPRAALEPRLIRADRTRILAGPPVEGG